MVYLKKRTVKGIDYYYAVENKKLNGKIVQKNAYYFGNKKPNKYEWQAVVYALKNKDVFNPKKHEITKDQIKRIIEINKRMQKDFKEMSRSEKDNFNEKFYNEYIYNTNSIEGSTLTKKETYFVTHDNKGIEGKDLKEIYMARNLNYAIKFIKDYKGDLTLRFIKKLHSIIQENIQPKEELGKYKKRQNYIIGNDFIPTPPALVKKRMMSLIGWYGHNKKKYSPFELACIFHIKFVSIHPFIDGNGRTARLIHNFILEKNDIIPIIYRTKTKQKYYSALKNAQMHGLHKPFIDYSFEEFINTYEGY
ncbi:Fic family protein [Candidatus Micrarchaeota archaeon]|jgi:Fic family protein|nr:Fic family protein [Candidatus Micrarchaeota archaeon]